MLLPCCVKDFIVVVVVTELFFSCICDVCVCVCGFMCEEHSRCVMTLLLSFREWRPLTEGILIPRIPFVGEVLCPGTQADK